MPKSRVQRKTRNVNRSTLHLNLTRDSQTAHVRLHERNETNDRLVKCYSPSNRSEGGMRLILRSFRERPGRPNDERSRYWSTNLRENFEKKKEKEHVVWCCGGGLPVTIVVFFSPRCALINRPPQMNRSSETIIKSLAVLISVSLDIVRYVFLGTTGS